MHWRHTCSCLCTRAHTGKGCSGEGMVRIIWGNKRLRMLVAASEMTGQYHSYRTLDVVRLTRLQVSKPFAEGASFDSDLLYSTK